MFRLSTEAVALWVGLAAGRLGRPSDALRESAEHVRFVAELRASAGAPLWHAPVLYFARRNRVGGITLGHFVYLWGQPALNDWRLLVHEVVHVDQVRRTGLIRFYVGYGWNFLRNLLAGMAAFEAYRQIGAEIEARSVEDVANQAVPAAPFVAVS
jgi:hypothetical protein